MKIIEQKELTAKQKQQLHILWNNEFSAKVAHDTIEGLENYLAGLTDHKHILVIKDEKILGWYFQFTRDNATWFSLIIDRSIHNLGYGSRLLTIAKENQNELNAWAVDHDRAVKLDGTAYPSPIEFYKKNGFIVLPKERLELDKISAVKIKWSSN